MGSHLMQQTSRTSEQQNRAAAPHVAALKETIPTRSGRSGHGRRLAGLFTRTMTTNARRLHKKELVFKEPVSVCLGGELGGSGAGGGCRNKVLA